MNPPSAQLHTILSAPWGTAPHRIETGWSAAPAIGLADGTTPSVARVAPNLRWDWPNRLSILCEDGNAPARGVAFLYWRSRPALPLECQHIGAPGQGAWRIEDTLVLPAQLAALVLDVLDDRPSLRLVCSDASTIWQSGERGIPALPDGAWQRLVADSDGGTWLVGRHGVVLRLDPATGGMSAGQSVPPWDGRAVADQGGRIFVVRYDPYTRQRLWTSFDPSDGSATSVTGDQDAYAFLAQPFGADRSGQAYGASWTEATPEVACIGRGGRPIWRTGLGTPGPAGRVQAVTSWAVAGDGSVLIPWQTEAGLIVSALHF